MGDTAEEVVFADAVTEASEVGAESRHRVAHGGRKVGDRGRGLHPLQPRLGPTHVARPTAHADDREFSFGADFVGDVENAGDF